MCFEMFIVLQLSQFLQFEERGVLQFTKFVHWITNFETARTNKDAFGSGPKHNKAFTRPL